MTPEAGYPGEVPEKENVDPEPAPPAPKLDLPTGDLSTLKATSRLDSAVEAFSAVCSVSIQAILVLISVLFAVASKCCFHTWVS